MLGTVSALGRTFIVLAFAATLTACIESEPEERKAFIAFLNTRVLDRPGVRVPKPNADEIKSFGPYAAHYDVITSFTGDPVLTEMAGKLRGGLPNLGNVQSLIDKRDELRSTSAEMGGLLRTMEGKSADAQAACNALKQPDDLKAVYDKAFDKTVVAPVNAFKESVPIAQEILTAAANLGDYVAARRTTVKIVGGQLQATNARTETEMAGLVNAVSAHASRYAEAQRKLRIVLTGN